MLLSRIVKQSNEKLRYIIDCASWLDDGENVSAAVTVQRLEPLDPEPVEDDTLEVDPITVDEDNPKRLLIWVSKGRDKSRYKVDLQITTSDQQIREDEIIFTIKDI